jgi:hypothetical protein
MPRVSLGKVNTDLERTLSIVQGQSLYYQGKNSSGSSFTRLIYGGSYVNCKAMKFLPDFSANNVTQSDRPFFASCA